MPKRVRTDDGRIGLFRRMYKRSKFKQSPFNSYGEKDGLMVYAGSAAVVSQFVKCPTDLVPMGLDNMLVSDCELPDYDRVFPRREILDVVVEFPEELINCLKAFRKPTLSSYWDVKMYLRGNTLYVEDCRDYSSLEYTNLKVEGGGDVYVWFDFFNLDLFAPKRIRFKSDGYTIPMWIESSYDKLVDSFEHVYVMPRRMIDD